MSDDTEYEAVFEPLPVRFEKPILLVPGLIVLSNLARGVHDACELMIDAINSHLLHGRDMNEFRAAATFEIETLVDGTDG